MKNEIRQGIYRSKNITIKKREFGEIFTYVDGYEYTTKAAIVPQKFRIGELVAYKEPGTNKINIGFSVCCENDSKHYDKELGVELAKARADNSFDKTFDPGSASVDVAFFAARAKRYFKDSVVPEWTEKLIKKYGA